MTEGNVGSLFICPTPIGNLQDVTLRVLRVLQDVALIGCEDTRHTRKLLENYRITTATISFHEHNQHERTLKFIEKLQAGQDIALVSDAGMPTISDPGTQLVAACHAADIDVQVLPGPSAITVAVALSGFALVDWRFVGFLPRKTAELHNVLSYVNPLVGFESPKRLLSTLEAASKFSPHRNIAICRELTKQYEEIDIGCASELYQRWQDRSIKGEIVLVFDQLIGGENPQLADAQKAVCELIHTGAAPRSAAKIVARLTGCRANELYRAALNQET